MWIFCRSKIEIVEKAYDPMDGGGRATQDAKAEFTRSK